MERWSGQIAVVTGASAGIGAAIAEKLVEHGLKVVGIARRKERIEELADKLKDKQGSLHAVKADVMQQEEIIEAFDWINKNVGPISILINNAGVGRRTTIIDGDIEEWKKVLDTNFLGTAIASREAIKSMQANKIDGHIVNINSTAGHQVPSLPYNNVYPATKFAVTALSETLRKDLITLGSKIKVTSVSPGCTMTEIFEANGYTDDEQCRELLKVVPSLKSEDVANAVVYVLGTPPGVQVTELTVKPLGEFV
ncbi:farnesol dehydrogenase [Diabrotica virgifera virgifera]|nr:farnesol dehydrogenase [Diabrotica virgifera virgifera]